MNRQDAKNAKERKRKRERNQPRKRLSIIFWFPNSVWEPGPRNSVSHPSPASETTRETEFRQCGSQTEFGNQKKNNLDCYSLSLFSLSFLGVLAVHLVLASSESGRA
jgi:hypothetical protein